MIDREARTSSALIDFRKRLQEALPSITTSIDPTERLEDLIPAIDRRRVWKELRDADLNLPPLRLAQPVVLVGIAAVVGPIALLMMTFRKASIILSAIEISVLVYRLLRPLAVRMPRGCETVREAALHLTPFTAADYKAGLWPHEDVLPLSGASLSALSRRKQAALSVSFSGRRCFS
jgi:hypothetical protein